MIVLRAESSYIIEVIFRGQILEPLVNCYKFTVSLRHYDPIVNFEANYWKILQKNTFRGHYTFVHKFECKLNCITCYFILRTQNL